jgi:hypothetical protein
MKNSKAHVLRLAVLLLACSGWRAAAGAQPSGPSGCPVDITRASTVPEGCPCNPAKDATFGTCSAGFVCSQPWTAQVTAAQSSRRLLLSPSGDVAATTADGPDASAGSGLVGVEPQPGLGGSGGRRFICVECGLGMLCKPGSVLPPILDPSIQM